MSIRTGAAYRRGLVDDRQVWFRGERVLDVTSHPAFRRRVDLVADLFDARGFSESTSDASGNGTEDPTRSSYLIPRLEQDLERRHAWSDWIAKTTCGLMGRSPDYLQTALMSFAAAAEYFGVDRNWSLNVQRLYARAAARDLFLARATVGPASDRSKPYSQHADRFVNVGVVRETDGAVVLRGAKMISTNAAVADELLVFPISGFQPGDEDYALGFMIPIATPGLKIVCREAFDDGTGETTDRPLTARFEESDSLCVFEDVVVPWERVFLYRNVELANNMYASTFSRNFTGYQTLIRSVRKAEFYAAIAVSCAEVNGCSRHLHVQEMLGEVLSYCDVMRGLLALAARDAFTNTWGVRCPGVQPATSARVLCHRYFARMVDVIQTIAAGTLFALPTERDLNAQISPLIENAFHTTVDGWSARKRILLFKMAHELVADGFGQRQLMYEKYHAGDPFRIAAAHFVQADHSQRSQLVFDALNAAVAHSGSDAQSAALALAGH